MRPALALLALLLLAPTAAALVVVQPSRFDLGEKPPGGGFEGVVHVTNKGSAPTRVEVAATVLEGETLVAEPSVLTLEPGETKPVSVRLLLPANASGGRHDPRLELVEAPAGEGAAMGRAALSVPLVFRVANLKVGNLEVRQPAPGEDAQARVLVQNFLDAPVEADVTLRVLDAAGAEVARAAGRAASAEPNASTSLSLALPTARLPPGVYAVHAEAAHEGHGSNGWVRPLVVGELRLGVRDALVRVGDAGRVVFAARVSNEGALALPGVVTFEFGGPGMPSRSVSADGGPLAPGDARGVAAEIDLPPGEYAARAVVHWAGGEASSEEMRFTVAGPGHPQAQTPVPLAALAGAAMVAAMALRRRA